ncbi:MAG TPA: hypothetical protein VFE22_15690 [Edaphobacter sp.]|nr:hypothetical protein [Edaphobacter sp.]
MLDSLELGILSLRVYQFTPVAKRPAPPEIVFLPACAAKRLEVVGVLASWKPLCPRAQHLQEWSTLLCEPLTGIPATA